jgi:putative endonuclease
MKLTGKDLGKWGENQAESYLSGEGVEILARNVQTEYGEIDLIGIIDNCILFIEVKTGQTRKYGFPEVSVNKLKMSHMVKAAQKYMQDKEDFYNDWRIDVVSIEVNALSQTEIKWFQNVAAE